MWRYIPLLSGMCGYRYTPMRQTSVCPRPGGDGEIDNENKGRRRNQETGRYESIKDALMDAYEAAVEVEKYYKEMRNGLVWHMA